MFKTSWISRADIPLKIRLVEAKITVKNWMGVAKFAYKKQNVEKYGWVSKFWMKKIQKLEKIWMWV